MLNQVNATSPSQNISLSTSVLRVGCGLYIQVRPKSLYVAYGGYIIDFVFQLLKTGATKQATALAEDANTGDLNKMRLSKSMAACAARSLIATLPYAIENHSGLGAYYSIYDYADRFALPTNSTQFFRFELFPERGLGGMRRYGQDIKCAKRINIHIGGTEISIRDLDREVNKPRSAYYIPDLRVHVFVHVVKRGKSTVRIDHINVTRQLC